MWLEPRSRPAKRGCRKFSIRCYAPRRSLRHARALDDTAALAMGLLSMSSLKSQVSKPYFPLVIFALATANTFAVFLSVQSCDGGVAFELVEGEISGLDGRVVLEVREGVEMVCWEQELQVPIPLPPPLAREIEDEVIGRWLARLDQVARGERDG